MNCFFAALSSAGANVMPELIDLSQELYSDMPVFSGMPPVRVTVHATHEQWEGLPPSVGATPAVNRLELSEHSGTHVDALSHMGRPWHGQTIDTMPLTQFYTAGICLDLSHRGPNELIEVNDLQAALATAGLNIEPGDTVLLYTDHYRRTFGSSTWAEPPGLSEEAARWLGQQRIAAFGVEGMSPGVRHLSNRAVHRVCGELGFTHYEGLINLHQLIGRGRFRFIALPLRIRGGSGSPVRAVAVIE